MIAFLLAASISIPAVIHHDQPMLRKDVVAICEVRVIVYEKPCVIVDAGRNTCFAFLDRKGQPTTVHCFPILGWKA